MVYSPPTRLSPISCIGSIILLGFILLLRLSSVLPIFSPRPPSLGSGPPHNVMVFQRHRVLRLWALVTRWRCSLYHAVESITTIPELSLSLTLLSVLVPVPTPVPAPISGLLPAVVLVIVLTPAPVPVFVSTFSLLPLVPGSSLGTTSSVRPTYRQNVLSTRTMPRSEMQSLVFYSALFLM